MTTEPTPVATPAVTPASTSTPGGSTPTPEPLAGDGQEQISLDEARKLRKENQTLRQRQKTIDEAEEAKRVAALSDLDRAHKDKADLEVKYQQAQKLLVESEVRYASKDKGIINPDLIAPAIMSKLEYGDDGKPTNLEKVLDDLIKANPFIVAKADAQPATPAQTNTPALPVMNPGRSSIQPPTGTIPGVRHRLSEYL